MALFQTSALNKYLKGIDENKVNEAYQKFTAFFHNETIIQNIREDKEEQFQYGFLQKLFDEVLDYTINPNPEFNLTTEFKNLRGSKKADGAILKDGKAIGVIELKSTNTKELNKITDQAFGYKNNHPTCSYIITSNFEKLRFYINDAVDYIDFDLFSLKQEEFKLLYLCLHKDHILGDFPQKIKKESTLQEENITKKLYKDYSAFKKALFNDLVMNNPDVDKLTLFKLSQKLIDRFLFILFAEDKGLLPPNSISKIVKTFDALEDLDSYKPLYEVFQQYFEYINTGRPARKDKGEIFAFNGGLFSPDEVLDKLKITDSILMNHTLILSAYDFESEIDVNILGHIFEHSLNEIDEMTAELEGQPIDKSKTKRKKDGVFYTPKYITKYIVDNTLGKLCEAQKETLGISDDEYRPNRNKATKKRLLADLEAYREYLLSLTICDPACGSGAFLNQALDFLINEHRYIDELQTKLLGGSIVLSDITNDILERNIYGVDINEESVDIARLSLWLRTAQKGRALTTLSDHIKCGNSLIDDPEVAGEKAFDWEKEFPEVFKKGGFDVVIGNPPYVRQELLTPFKPYFQKTYQTFQGTADLFTYFIEISVDRLINQNGLYSIIVANKWMRANYGKPLRHWIKNKWILEIIDFGDLPVFKDVTAYPCILTISPETKSLNFYAFEPKTLDFGSLTEFVAANRFVVSKSLLKDEGWALIDLNKSELLEKINSNGIQLKKFVKGKVYRGLTTGLNEAFVVDIKTKKELISEDPNCEKIIKPFLAGKEVTRYSPPFTDNYLIYAPWNIDINAYPSIKKHLTNYKEKLNLRPEVKKGRYPWYSLSRYASEYWFEYEKPKIITPAIVKKASFSFDSSGSYSNDKTNIIGSQDKYLLAVLNSKLCDFVLHNIASTKSGGYFEYKPMYISLLPIKNVCSDNELLIKDKLKSKVDLILISNKDLQNQNKKFLRALNRRLSINNLSKNLQNWHNLTFAEFIKELKKKKIKLSLSEEAEWEDYFEQEKAKAQVIQSEIDKTDKEIDLMVYELYGLTEKEIAIVENA